MAQSDNLFLVPLVYRQALFQSDFDNDIQDGEPASETTHKQPLHKIDRSKNLGLELAIEYAHSASSFFSLKIGRIAHTTLDRVQKSISTDAGASFAAKAIRAFEISGPQGASLLPHLKISGEIHIHQPSRPVDSGVELLVLVLDLQLCNQHLLGRVGVVVSL